MQWRYWLAVHRSKNEIIAMLDSPLLQSSAGKVGSASHRRCLFRETGDIVYTECNVPERFPLLARGQALPHA